MKASKYLVCTYQEGKKPDGGLQFNTLHEARSSARSSISIHDICAGRSMKKYTGIVGSELSGYSPVEDWTPQGGTSPIVRDITTIFRLNAPAK